MTGVQTCALPIYGPPSGGNDTQAENALWHFRYTCSNMRANRRTQYKKGSIMKQLNEKVAIVTGAGQGIGKGIALCLAKRGCKIIATGRRLEPIEATIAEIKNLFTKTRKSRAQLCHPCDLWAGASGWDPVLYTCPPRSCRDAPSVAQASLGLPGTDVPAWPSAGMSLPGLRKDNIPLLPGLFPAGS